MNEKDTLLIEQYLDNQLSDNEKREVEIRLQEDKEFADLFAFIKDVQATVSYSSKSDFKDKLDEVALNYDQEIGRGANRTRSIKSFFSNKPLYNYLAIAASVTAIIVVSAFIMLTLLSDNKNTLVAEGKDLDFIRTYIEKNPETVSGLDTEVLPVALYQKYGSITDLTPPPSEYLNKFLALDIVVIQDSPFENAYFLTDTLFLFGAFDDSVKLFYEEKSEIMYLQKGLESFSFSFNRTDTITPFRKRTGSLENLPQYENN